MSDEFQQNRGTDGRADATDRSLMRRFRAGDDDAATALYVRYAERLQRLAGAEVGSGMVVRVDADDIVQSVFRTFFRRAADGQYDVGDREDLWKLLLVMALNKIRSQAKYHGAAKRRVSSTVPLAADANAAHGEPQESLAYQVLKMTVEEVVGALPEEQQPIIWLRIEGCEVEEISERTGRAKRSVERILQSFRSKLQRVLHESS